MRYIVTCSNGSTLKLLYVNADSAEEATIQAEDAGYKVYACETEEEIIRLSNKYKN